MPRGLRLLLGLLCGGLAVVLMAGGFRPGGGDAGAAPTPTPVPVLVATRDLPVGAVIGPEDVAVRAGMGGPWAPQTLTRPEEAVGKYVRVPLLAGEPVLRGKLQEAPPPQGPAARIPTGRRALAVRVDEVVAAGGILRPGDRVDVVAVFDRQTYGKEAALLLLQNIAVLAVGMETEGESPADRSSSRTGEGAAAAAARTAAFPKTVTLLVTPEEAQRLALAEKTGTLRLVLRAPGDASVLELPEATLSTLREVTVPQAQIVSVRLSPTVARAGDTLTVEVVVKNTADRTLRSQGPPPGFTYIWGQTYHTQGFPSEPGAVRVGLSFGGQPAVPFPFRWGLGGDLSPGATATVVGKVRLTHALAGVPLWVGLVVEPATVLQDNVGTTTLTVLPADVVVVAVDAANVRAGPALAAPVVTVVPYGTALPVVGQEKDWYRVRLPDGREGYVAAGWIVRPEERR
jgi:pilus assembly protein CpaB